MNAKAKLPDPWGKLSRRRFVAVSLAGLPGFILAAEQAASPQDPAREILVQDPGGTLARTQAPCRVSLALTTRLRQAAAEGRLYLREQATRHSGSSTQIPVQCLGPSSADNPILCWLMPSEASERKAFVLEESPRAGRPTMQVLRQEGGSRFEIAEEGKPVLQYNYAKVEPGDLLDKVSDSNRKYAVARNDYIHPLYGPQGEILTRDWPLEHPHHRGIYLGL